MIQGSLSDNASTDWIQTEGNGGVHIAVKGGFGGGQIKIEQRINGSAYATQESDGTVIVHTANFNRHISFEKHDVFRITLSGATSPSLDYSISGRIGWVYN